MPHGTGQGAGPVRHRERLNARGQVVPNVRGSHQRPVPLDVPHGGGAFTAGGRRYVAPARSGPGLGPDRVATLRDQARLLSTALDHQQPPARRLSALRELRVRHGIPVTQRDYLNAITPRQKVHKHSFLHKALHAVEGAGKAVGHTLGFGQVGPRKLGSGGYPAVDLLRNVASADVARYKANQTGAMLAQNQGQIKTAGFDPSSAVLGIAALSSKASRAISNARVPYSFADQQRHQFGPAAGRLARNAAQDFVDLPAQTLASGYLSIHDPASVVKSTLATLKHPISSFEQHPISTALILRGIEGGLSRGVGSGLRAFPKGTRAHSLGSTERAPLRLTGNALQRRSYSKGAAEKAVQVALDERQRRAHVARTRAEHAIRHMGAFREGKRLVQPVDASVDGPEISRLEAENEKIAMRVETETTRARKANRNGEHSAGAKAAEYVRLAEQRIADNNGRIAQLKAHARQNAPAVTRVLNAKEIDQHMRAHGVKPPTTADKLAPIQATPHQLHGATGYGGMLGRRFDIAIGQNHQLTQQARDQGYAEMYRKGVAPTKGGTLHHGADLAPLISEGAVKKPRTVERDLRLELKRLTDPQHVRDLTPHEAQDNRANVEIVQRLLADKKFLANPGPAFKAAGHYAAELGKREGQRVDFQDLTPEQARRRVLLPFAVRELGLSFNETTGRFEAPAGSVPIDRVAATERASQLPREISAARRAVTRARSEEKTAVAQARAAAASRRRAMRSGRLSARERAGGASAAGARLRPRPDLTRAQGERLMRAQGNRVAAEGRLRALESELSLKRAHAKADVIPDNWIINEFVKRGGDPSLLAYVPQRPNFKGPGNFWQGGIGRPGAENQRFTGAVTMPAAYQRDYEVLAQKLARDSMKIEKHRATNNLLNQFGHTRPNGELFANPAEALKEGRSQEVLTGRKLMPVTVSRKNAISTFEQMMNPHQLSHDFTPAQEGDKNVALMDAAVIERLNHHQLASAKVPVMRAWQAWMQRFRHVVLPTSPKWPTGNISEMELRIGMHDPTLGARSIPSGVLHERRLAAMPGGARLVQEMQAAAARGMFGSQKTLDIHREPLTAVGRFVHGLSNAGVGPRDELGPKGLVDGWEGYKKLIFGANEVMESGIYYSALDRFMRQKVQELTGDWHKTLSLQGKAYEEVYKQFRDPHGQIDQNTIAEFANMLDKMRGRYANLSPSARFVVSTMTPFAPWYVNALYFALVTLPKTHPVKTALLASMFQATEKKRSALGLTHFPDKGGVKPLPGFLQGSIPLTAGLARYNQFTPFGAFGDPLETASNLVLPQFGFLANFGGLNFKGQRLKDVHGNEPDILVRALIALNTAAESMVPFVRQARQFREQGGTSVDTSTLLSPQVKPGSKKGVGVAAQKTFNPFYVSGNKPGAGGYSGPPLTGSKSGTVDWSKVDWGKAGGGQIDWSKVKWGAAK